MLPQLRVIVHRRLIPIVFAVVGNVKAGAAKVAHVADLVPLEAAGVRLPHVAGDCCYPVLALQGISVLA